MIKDLTLIGVTHRGEASAQRMIETLIKLGLKEGDTVALEGLSRHQTMPKLPKSKEELRLQLRPGYDIDSYNQELEFFRTIINFIKEKNASFSGIDILTHKLSAYSRTTQPFRDLVLFPAREKIMLKAIAVVNPKYVIVGAKHLHGLRKLLPESKVVDLSYRNRLQKFVQWLKVRIISNTYERRRSKKDLKPIRNVKG